jgi:hypothetical protein|uniref:Uncharacterized protein n=1 Tax=Myoviridae sp. ctyWv1 TaxID=2826718 RepID=A0A8S5QXP0_9CAUD|nr:MAG TPA: hypothetical protein [Myoviridae sp. ctyWv1]
MVKYIDDGVLLGWYFCREGCCWETEQRKQQKELKRR